MTQFNPMPPPMPPGGPGGVVAFSSRPPAPPVTSGLAVASLVCALLFCIPFLTPALAVLFGVIALIGISRSAGRKRGTGLAAAGLVIGSLALLMHIAAVVMVVGIGLPLLEGMTDQFETFVLNVEADKMMDARAMLTPSAQKLASRSDHRQLAALLKKDFGSFKSVSFDWTSGAYQRGVAPAGGGNPFAIAARSSGGASAAAGMGGIPLCFKAEFSKAGTVYGLLIIGANVSASAGSQHASASATPLAIESFTLIGPNGPWTFPFPPGSLTSPSPAPTPTPTPADAEDAKDDSSDNSDDGGY